MQRQTFEKAIHSWDPWHKSIEESRNKLSYDPCWPVGKAIPWIEKHYSSIRDQGKQELKKLVLPPNLQTYWEDCFYSNYRDKEGKTDYKKITRRLSDQKSLPELPYDQGLTWHEEEDINNPWLRIEIRLHACFATKELYRSAASSAFESAESSIKKHKIPEHPLCKFLKGGRPLINEDRALECARLRDDLGMTNVEIGKKFGWKPQFDSHGNLSQCPTASRYVKRGRELRKMMEKTNQ